MMVSEWIQDTNELLLGYTMKRRGRMRGEEGSDTYFRYVNVLLTLIASAKAMAPGSDI